MKRMNLLSCLALAASLAACGGAGNTEEAVFINPESKSLSCTSDAQSLKVKVDASASFEAYTNDEWISGIDPHFSDGPSASVSFRVAENLSVSSRTGGLIIRVGTTLCRIDVVQEGHALDENAIRCPLEGYDLVWNDEFLPGSSLSSKWTFENWNPGYVNNELQRYVSGGKLDDRETAFIDKDGVLNIVAQKYNGQVISARMNSRQSWQFGYIEASICLPKGKGTWPAFWMMPQTVDWVNEGWPKCGEIDIMEEVGYRPNYVSSSLHAEGHNHTNGTQVTGEVYCAGAEGEFHLYAMEWTEKYIQFYVDGKKTLYYANDGKGVRNWPYSKPYYVILNLAWGGDWGGQQGVDESALPATYKIDYVRVFRKN